MLFPSCLLILQLFIFARMARGVATPKSAVNERLKGLVEEKGDEQGEKKNVLKLEIFDAKDLKSLSRWYCMTAGIDTEAPASDLIQQLQKESCKDKLYVELDKDIMMSMCEALDQAENNLEDCNPKLSRPECLAVYMYTSEFYKGYNRDIRKGKWEPYKVFTALLFSALVKIDRAAPLSSDTHLYRGMDKEFTVDSSGRFYFKQFVSTTVDREVAEMFGTATIMVIVPSVPIIAAKLDDLSKYPGEEEVLISPFEAFEFVNKTGNVLYFKSAESQDFLHSPTLVCPEDIPEVKQQRQGPGNAVKVGADETLTTKAVDLKKVGNFKVHIDFTSSSPDVRYFQLQPVLFLLLAGRFAYFY